MPKIEQVITHCYQCRYCKRFDSPEDNYSSAYVCTYKKSSDPEIEPFLISLGGNRLEVCQADIPDNCPLEDYTPAN